MSEAEFSYDEIADAYAAAVDTAPYNALYERPAMLEMMPPVAGARVLEAGCGAGWYTEQLLARGARVTAGDASAAMVDHARRRIAGLAAEAAARAELHVADLTRPLRFAADGAYDGVLSALVMHYIADLRPAFAELRRVLKPGGWLLFSTHYPFEEAVRLAPERYLATEPVEEHWKWVGRVRYHRRPLSAITDALADAGLAVERLAEPLPTEAFRRLKPDAYARLLRHPAFLFVLARPW